jgi:hypothetical protein
MGHFDIFEYNTQSPMFTVPGRTHAHIASNIRIGSTSAASTNIHRSFAKVLAVRERGGVKTKPGEDPSTTEKWAPHLPRLTA